MRRRYLERTQADTAFYEGQLRPRLPRRIFDVHVHVNLPEHVAQVPPERVADDWALQCGAVLPAEDAFACAAELFPHASYRIAAFPWPIREADLAANNRYLAQVASGSSSPRLPPSSLTPFMAVRPEWDPERLEEELVRGHFTGFKPYPDMVSGRKGAEIGIFEFLPHLQWRILDRHGGAVMLHLGRRERIADRDNLRDLQEARQRYPRVTIIVAHFGRSFCSWYLEQALKELGGAEGLNFDTSAVINPATYDLAFSRLAPEQILFGTDMPILFWHGRRSWTEREYRNLCREDYPWNRRHEPAEVEAGYTLFLYEQMRAILDAMDRQGMGTAAREAVFYGNAARLLAFGNGEEA